MSTKTDSLTWLASAGLAWLSFLTTVLISAAGQAAERQAAPGKPHVVFIVGTTHYSPEKSMPVLAKRLQKYGVRTTVILPQGDPEHNKNKVGLPGLEVLAEADAAVFFLRFLELPKEQLGHLLKYVESGKPVIGLRTSTHAFAYPKGHEFEKWNDGFGRDVLGSKYFIHLRGSTEVEVVPAAERHAILKGVASKFTDPGMLYKVQLPADAAPLLMGTGRSKRVGVVKNAFGTHELKPVMSWPVAWTWKNKWGGRVFATTIGHVDSFKLDAVNRLLINAIHWALDRPVEAP